MFEAWLKSASHKRHCVASRCIQPSHACAVAQDACTAILPNMAVPEPRQCATAFCTQLETRNQDPASNFLMDLQCEHARAHTHMILRQYCCRHDEQLRNLTKPYARITKAIEPANTNVLHLFHTAPAPQACFHTTRSKGPVIALLQYTC